MLVQLNLKSDINLQYADRGVHFETTSNETFSRFFSVVTDPSHPFWQKNTPNGKATTIFRAGEESPGIYWGWNLDNNIRDYFDCELLERFPSFCLESGNVYNDNDKRDMMFDNITVMQKPYPSCELHELAGSYGVCDNINQVLDKYKAVVDNPHNQIVITLSSIKKSEQDPNGGWRWHKWGEYIGTHKIKHEYLYDEEGIEEVLCFHILSVKKD